MKSTRRIWWVAGVVAAVSGVPVALFANSIPHLIAVPIIAGAIIAAVLDLVQKSSDRKSDSCEK